ncbi:hypothetical protein VTL71DRAFT_10333 [Oculimacula yallundae]|uniref:Uncharacterized protein n=1 Tax=Oculimacula yallundae TaxID=86028 RepID=A0ABR4CV95_9HELO
MDPSVASGQAAAAEDIQQSQQTFGGAKQDLRAQPWKAYINEIQTKDESEGEEELFDTRWQKVSTVAALTPNLLQKLLGISRAVGAIECWA